MVKLIFFVKRRAELSPDEFRRYWREQHGPMFAATEIARRYVVRYEQNHRDLRDYDRGEPDYDGVGIQWYRSLDDMRALFADPEYTATVRPDEQRFIDHAGTTWIVTEEEKVFLPD